MTIAHVAVRELAEQIRGVTFDKSDASPVPLPGYLPVLRAGNIGRDGLTFDDLVFVPASRVSSKQLLQRNDVVIAASSGSLDVVGKAAPLLVDYVGGFGAFCKVLRPGPTVDPSYFAQYFKTPGYRRRISALAEGNNINNLRNEHLDDLHIPLPPLPEQRRVAEVLDRAQALRAKRRTALAQLDALTQSIFLEMFGDPATNSKGWAVRELADVAQFFAGGTLPRGELFAGQDTGYLLVKVSDMNRPGNDKYLATSREWSCLRGSAAATCPGGSVVIPKRGASIATNKKRLATRESVLDPNLMGISPKEELITSQYMYGWFSQLDLATITSGSSVPQLNKRDLAPLVIPVPPASLQQEFSRRISALELLRVRNWQSATQHDVLFASLQYRAFRGEL